MRTVDRSMALTGEPPKALDLSQKLATLLGLSGLGILVLALLNIGFSHRTFWLTASLSAITLGTIWFTWASYAHKPAGIKNDGVMFKSISSRGFWGWVSGILLTGFYIVLYF